VPFIFVCDPLGIGLLGKVPKGGSWFDIALITAQTGAGIALLAFAFQGRFLKQSNVLETVLFTLAGLLLVFPSLVDAVTMLMKVHVWHPLLIAIVLAAAAVGMQLMRPSPGRSTSST
jgi:TRAP-type uncharacterized transport system fused permease subunit